VRLYGQDYKNRLEAAGFKVDVVNYGLKLSREVFEKYALPKRELLYIGKK